MTSQIDRIKAKLDTDGLVTRNHCLRSYPAITRLSARINDLKNQGYIFKEENVHGDYVYHLVAKPQGQMKLAV